MTAWSPERLPRRPPSCLRKNGTPALSHWSRRLRAHSGSIGRAARPLSPPVMTHWTSPESSQGLRSTAPAAARRTRTGWARARARAPSAAGRTSGIRPTSPSTRSQATSRRNRPGARSTTRPPGPGASSAPGKCGRARLRRAASRRRSRTRTRRARAGWNTSDMLLTKTRRGRFQFSGAARRSGSSWTCCGSALVPAHSHRPQARVHGEHVAVVAAGGDPGAAGHRVPGLVSPFDRRWHDSQPLYILRLRCTYVLLCQHGCQALAQHGSVLSLLGAQEIVFPAKAGTQEVRGLRVMAAPLTNSLSPRPTLYLPPSPCVLHVASPVPSERPSAHPGRTSSPTPGPSALRAPKKRHFSAPPVPGHAPSTPTRAPPHPHACAISSH